MHFPDIILILTNIFIVFERVMKLFTQNIIHVGYVQTTRCLLMVISVYKTQ